MDTGYYKFYRSKKVLLLTLLPIVLFFAIAVVYWDSQIFGFLALVVFLFLLITVGVPVLKHQPFIEITPSYIKINNWDKLFWADIERAEIITKDVSGRSLLICNLLPKDVSKYRLTLVQKGNMKMKLSPFSIMLPGPLQEEDLEKLIKILKERVPNNNIK